MAAMADGLLSSLSPVNDGTIQREKSGNNVLNPSFVHSFFNKSAPALCYLVKFGLIHK
jgi:hypothetical protein